MPLMREVHMGMIRKSIDTNPRHLFLSFEVLRNFLNFRTVHSHGAVTGHAEADTRDSSLPGLPGVLVAKETGQVLFRVLFVTE